MSSGFLEPRTRICDAPPSEHNITAVNTTTRNQSNSFKTLAMSSAQVRILMRRYGNNDCPRKSQASADATFKLMPLYPAA